MKSSIFIVLVSLIYNTSLHCANKKEQLQKKADDKLQEAFEKTMLGGLETAAGIYRATKGDITGGFAIVEGARNMKKGYDSFQEGCKYNQEAREITNND